MWFNSVFFIPPTRSTISGEPHQLRGQEFTFSGMSLQLRLKSFTISGIEI
ncbi:hypothetical protein KY360_04380 [Candidatus Woesearchaeota archaeon]|nr:hypothetical protein [Candidatus Woesearchaeota archaeon]